MSTNILLIKRLFSTSPTNLTKINHVAVFGSGLMGSGIAQVSAEAGYKVTLIDQNDAILAKALAGIKQSLQRSSKKKFEKEPQKAEKHTGDTLSRISTCTSSSLEKGDAARADLIIEAIVENMKAKHELFGRLDKLAPPNTLFASNTSSLPIGEIAESVVRKDKFGGLHFFNPVPVMKLLEVIRTSNTSDSTHNAMLEYGRSIGKTTVECKDTPGFIVNRLLVPYLFEAVRMYERGEASLRDIDTAMKLGAGYPMGPFELADYVGLDTSKFIIDGWQKRYPNVEAFKSSKLVDKLVADGKLGRKTGSLFIFLICLTLLDSAFFPFYISSSHNS
jgi:3-hydroxyacyl-CoA dehydrogenase